MVRRFKKRMKMKAIDQCADRHRPEARTGDAGAAVERAAHVA
jgi:hypothetical protein